jgi:hypothetical protein
MSEHSLTYVKNAMTDNSFYPALVLFEQANCIDSINFYYINSLTEIYSFFWCPFHMLPVELWEPNCTSSSLPVDRKYQKGAIKG